VKKQLLNLITTSPSDKCWADRPPIVGASCGPGLLQETGEDGPYWLFCNSRLASHDDANYGGVEWSSRSGRDVGAQTRQNSRQIPRSGAGQVCGSSSSGRNNRDFAAIADACLGSHESPPEREIARHSLRTTLRAPCESDLAWRPTYVASISQKRRTKRSTPLPEFMFRIRGYYANKGKLRSGCYRIWPKIARGSGKNIFRRD